MLKEKKGGAGGVSPPHDTEKWLMLKEKKGGAGVCSRLCTSARNDMPRMHPCEAHLTGYAIIDSKASKIVSIR